MGIFDGAGIHGTDREYGSIGTRRLARLHPHARSPTSMDLYDQVPVGAPIYIA